MFFHATRAKRRKTSCVWRLKSNFLQRSLCWAICCLFYVFVHELELPIKFYVVSVFTTQKNVVSSWVEEFHQVHWMLSGQTFWLVKVNRSFCCLADFRRRFRSVERTHRPCLIKRTWLAVQRFTKVRNVFRFRNWMNTSEICRVFYWMVLLENRWQAYYFFKRFVSSVHFVRLTVAVIWKVMGTCKILPRAIEWNL